MFNDMRRALARWIAPARKGAARMYQGAMASRLTAGWQPQTGSSDSELWSSLTQLRNRSRALMRDTPYAKRAKTVIVNNVIGSGISMEPNVRKPRGALDETVNDAIEAAWDEWSRAENCHTGGKLHFCDMERLAFGEIIEAGEVLLRKHYQPFGSSRVPLALEVIEAERLADDTAIPVAGVTLMYRMGVERDSFGRPTDFYIRKFHPGEVRYAGQAPNILEKIPASEIFHLYVLQRWPQTRGEPWLHSAIRRLNDMDGYSEAEIVAARAAACYMGIITTPDEMGMADGPPPPGEAPQFELEPGAVPRLAPGEVFSPYSPNRPNSAIDPFMRLMIREVAAGADVSYESLSRDYSQSNFSSSRLALLDDRDLWRVFQQFFIRNFREPLHREWLRAAIYANAIKGIKPAAYLADPAYYEAVSWKPRGWGWIDPVKEVEAYKQARRAGFISTARIVSLTGDGADLEDMWEEIAQENADAKDKNIVVTTDPGVILEARETNPTVVEPAAEPTATPTASAPEPANGGNDRILEVVAAVRALAVAVANTRAPESRSTGALTETPGEEEIEVIERDASGAAKRYRRRRKVAP
jgi:lambda family phage portal protein